jgi:transcriptional regulator with XRE-family HTH domain
MKKERGDKARRRVAALKGKKKPNESFADVRARYRHQHREHAMVAVLDAIDRARQLASKPPAGKNRLPVKPPAASVRDTENIVATHRSIVDARITHRAKPSETKKRFDQLNELWKKLRAENNEAWLMARDRLLEQFGSAEGQSRIERGEQPSPWLRLLKDFERAVLNRDASWFEAQARAIKGIGFHQTRVGRRRKQEQDRRLYELAVLCALQHAPDMTEQDILEWLKPRKEGSYLVVEGCKFSSARRCRADIKRLRDALTASVSVDTP